MIAFMVGECVGCRTIMQFNPHKVPSLKVDGKREPLCRACAEEHNRIHRTDKGLEPIPIHPEAYEPIPEDEL